MSDEKYGLYLKWDKSVDEAVTCLVQIANGSSKEQWYQHEGDTRGIVTERAAVAIRERVTALRAALAFYADVANYVDSPYGGGNDVEADGGRIAREALGDAGGEG